MNGPVCTVPTGVTFAIGRYCGNRERKQKKDSWQPCLIEDNVLYQAGLPATMNFCDFRQIVSAFSASIGIYIVGGGMSRQCTLSRTRCLVQTPPLNSGNIGCLMSLDREWLLCYTSL